MAISVATRSYNNARTGVNDQETVLTPDLVRKRGVARLFSLRLDDVRGAEAQPLVLSMGSGPDDALAIICTMSNSVIAFHVRDGSQAWRLNLGNPVLNGVSGSRGNIDSKFINPTWGILSTPVIDPDTKLMYVVSWSSSSADPQTSLEHSEHRLHAVDLKNGTEARPPLSLNGIVDAPSGLSFRSKARKQRSALVLARVPDGSGGSQKTLFIPCGSIGEVSRDGHGWVIAVDVNSFRVTATFITSRRGKGAGIWQGAQGPCIDDHGRLYFLTGNGDWDAKDNWSESVIALQYKPPQHGSEGSLAVVDWFTPFLDHSVDQHGTVVHGRQILNTNHRFYDWADQDLGSGGAVLLRELQLVVGAGKDGILYVLDQNNLGKTSFADLENPAQNYSKLKSPALFLTFNGVGFDPMPHDARDLSRYMLDGKTHHLHGSPIFWNSPDLGPALYCWGENQALRAWSIDHGVARFLAEGREIASEGHAPPGGMPGGMLTLSCNGANRETGIVWSLAPMHGDANSDNNPPPQGVFRAYDATRFIQNPDGSKTLDLIWNSDRWNINFSHNKFNLPVVANGRIYVPTYDGTIDVYGPTP